jgi:hypothetical protein
MRTVALAQDICKIRQHTKPKAVCCCASAPATAALVTYISILLERETNMRKPGIVLFFFALLTICASLHAQTVDTAIVGTISDSSGAVISNATVTVTSLATGIEKKALTASGGTYSVNYLIPGTYAVTASATGFGTDEQRGIELQINQQARVNITLQVGATSQVVSVEASEQPLLQTQDASLGVVVGTQTAASLPLNGRKFEDLGTLTPGVTVTDTDTHSGASGGATINAYGNANAWPSFNLDGITMGRNRESQINLYPSVDAVQEFKIFTNTGNAEAEYGDNAGTITNVQLKSGSNNLHGDAFEFVRNPVLDARNYFRVAPLPKQLLKQNQFGATVGGPIIKDRTFFFFSYEGLRSLEQVASLANVLTAPEENGDFSALLPGKQLKSPYTGANYLNNQIPVDKVAQQIAIDYMPLPNTSQNGENYSDFTSGNESVNQYILRLDHKINDANQLAFHFVHAFRNFPFVAADPHFTFTGTFPLYNLALQYIHTFSPSMVNELHLGYDYEHIQQLSTRTNTSFTAASLGINGFVQPNGSPWPPTEEGFPVLSISGFLGMGDSNATSNIDNSVTYQLVDNITWIRGKHTFVYGTDIRYKEDNGTTDNTPWGSITFNGAETGNAAADFILGVPSSIITPEGVPLTAARQWQDALYLQDNWKVTPSLTVNAGLRWEVSTPPHDDLPTSRTLAFTSSTSAVNPPTLEPLPTPLWHISHNDYAPRVGFNYSLPWNSVLRGGYGISWYQGQVNNIYILQLNPPADPSYSLANGTTPANPPTATIDNPVSPSITPATPNETSIPPDGKHPDMYLQGWNLTLSKQFWSNVIDVSYVGSKATHWDTSIPYYNNGPPQPAGLSVNANRPFPTIGNIRMLDFHGASSYNGLNVHFQHRFTHNLEFTSVFSWSHLLDNQGGDTNGVRNETQIPTAKEWASGLTNVPRNLTIAFVYQLPKLAGGDRAARAVLNGWNFNGIFQFIDGSPLYVDQSADGENDGNLFQRPDLTGQPIKLSNKSIGEWFNTAAFTEAIGHYGSTPRNPVGVQSPAVDPLTLSIGRSFATPWEGQHLDFRMESFNTLNTPQFAAPGVAQGSSTFGKISATTIDNREVQLGLKYIF